MRKIVFISGTRADYGKIKSLMKKVEQNKLYELHIFVTGMQLLSKYGSTYREIEKDGFKNVYKYINQKDNVQMDIALSNTILGFSNYVSEINPDMIVVHGDRLEALAGAIVGAFNNIKVVHIEGGEVSGTIDESIRHAITKFSHIHLVANEQAKNRVIQLGEREESIFVIGSPDIDIMTSNCLPNINIAKKHYEINFNRYAILVYHPVTTMIENLKKDIKHVVDALIESRMNYIVIYPNNDPGNKIILEEYRRFDSNPLFRVFPSIRFESFLTLLKHSNFIIGNSSAGIRESGVYGIPSIDIGYRQLGRYDIDTMKNIIHVNNNNKEILNAIDKVKNRKKLKLSLFGEGNSSEKFMKILENPIVWDCDYQKNFIDINENYRTINSNIR